MAHKTENEESVTVPENTITTLCVNCGVATNYTSNNNSCQKCMNINKVYVEKSSVKNIYLLDEPITISTPTLETSPKVVSVFLTKSGVNRCTGCRKKVGLTGFTCRCGDLFCSEHRYSDRHDCSYDYKAAGREMIKRENPVVKASKIVRI